ncbi:hypothetical protein ACFL02_00510 [Planctomycetota bacterium]
MLCRVQIEIKRLHWDQDRILVSLLSAKNQSVILEAPSEITGISVQRGNVLIGETEQKNSRNVSLAAGQEISLEIKMK